MNKKSLNVNKIKIKIRKIIHYETPTGKTVNRSQR